MAVNAVAICPLPDCNEELHITTSFGGTVYADGTADTDLTSTWSVECSQGHVVLLPPDTAADYYMWDMDASARLRALTGGA